MQIADGPMPKLVGSLSVPPKPETCSRFVGPNS